MPAFTRQNERINGDVDCNFTITPARLNAYFVLSKIMYYVSGESLKSWIKRFVFLVKENSLPLSKVKSCFITVTPEYILLINSVSRPW